jgi:hypothetical protein
MDWISDNRVLRSLDMERHTLTASEERKVKKTKAKLAENAQSATVL